jgi:hypothetical protein
VKELSLHILDIAENSITASATRIEIKVEELMKSDRLRIEVRDNGSGMDAEMAAMVTSPFVTTRTTRKVGLGIPLLKEAAEACNGSFMLESTPGAGTNILVEFRHSHIDRMPLGDLAGTWMTLMVSHPYITWVFEHRTDEKVFRLDSGEVTAILDGLPMCDPAVLSFLRTYIDEGVKANSTN